MLLRPQFSRLLFTLSIFSIVFVISALALEVPSRPDGYVTDHAQMLSPQMRAHLEAKLKTFEEETSNQVVVATFPSLEGDSLEGFSIRLAEAWKVGQKGKDNGVILLVFKMDRAVRIEVGYGLEGVLPDAISKQIIENEIVPRFREGKFDEGIYKAVEAIIAQTKGEYKGEHSSVSIDWVTTFTVIVILITILIFGFFGPFGPWGIPAGYTISSGRKRTSRGSGSNGGSGGFGGGGGFSGGGFSGGGGSFGGGGASGRW
ncbi:MAG: TPM domain-containing protein [Candidatus Omnitrophica bacterium]|nr:TPM domain-containing protein [Candidatus Omnitrophota bacterium]